MPVHILQASRVLVEEPPVEEVLAAPKLAPRTLAERVAVLEQKSGAVQSLGLLQRIEELSTEIAELRGQLEEYQHKVALQSPSAMPHTGPASEPVAPTPAVTPRIESARNPVTAFESETNLGDDQQLADQQLYGVAYEHLKAKAYTEAVQALQRYLQKYPEGRYRVQAHYWLGEIYLVQNQWNIAQEQFNWVMQQAPSDQKAADALFKLGLIQLQQEKTEEAKKIWKQLKERYPHSMAARLAQNRLTELPATRA